MLRFRVIKYRPHCLYCLQLAVKSIMKVLKVVEEEEVAV